MGGAFVWIALRVMTELSPTARVLAVAPLVVVPLALSLLPLGTRRGALVIALSQPLGAACATVSLLTDVGARAAALAAVWLTFVAGTCTYAALRLLADDAPDRTRVSYLAALLFWPVGGAWMVAARAGWTVLGFDGFWAELTAIHFHYMGLAAPILVGRMLATKGPGLGTTLSLVGITLGPVLVAAGITVSPVAALLGALSMAAGLGVHGVRSLWPPGRPRRLAVVCFWISAISVLFSMPLAVIWAWGTAAGTMPFGLDLGWMIRLHGMANAHGFCLVGLIGWVLLEGEVASPAGDP